MSGISILKSGLVASACVAGLALSGCATSQGSDSRYGGVADYESGDDCTTSPCGPVVDSRYGSTANEDVVYTDCGTVASVGCAPAPQPVYQAPPVYEAPPAPMPVAQPTVQYVAPPAPMGPIDCPAGTTDSGNGTCMMSSSGTSYSGTTSYSSGTTYSSGATTSYSGERADCLPGTTDAGDGTCMQGSGSSAYTGSSATIYGSSTTTDYADCPAGSTRSASGTCAVSSGYTPAPTYTPPQTYLPIRK
jgi:hypothetical protein